MITVLFACVHNAGRSQMAAAYFNALADPTRARAISAGTEPGTRVHPEVAAVMAEDGFDLGSARPQLLTNQVASSVQLLVTMGCGESCPFIPGLKRDDWAIDDPKGRPIEDVRAIRNTVRDHVETLLRDHGWSRKPDALSGPA